jgi:hypothetical protein
VNATDADPLLYARDVPTFVAVGAEIVSGFVEGVNEEEVELAVEFPLALVAIAVKV